MDNRFQPRAWRDPAQANRFGTAAVSGVLARSPASARQGARTAFEMSAWSQPMSASNRTLVILIENGGVDLGIPALVEKLSSSMPGGENIPDGYKKKLVDYLHQKIIGLTDSLIETAELSLNRYTAARPDYFGSVVVLRNGTASYDEMKKQLISLSREGRIIDLLILTHGGDDSISVTGGISGRRIRDMRTDFGKALSIRSVYMMNCVGSSLNQAWLDAGAKTSSGAIRNNYLPEPTTYFFWQAWKAGQPFDSAVSSAYQKTIALMNDVVRDFISALPTPLNQLASLVNFADMDFVKDSAPVIQGETGVTIASDDLVFSQSLAPGRSLAMTVLPVGLLRSIAAAQSVPAPTRPACKVSPQGIAFIKGHTPFQATPYDNVGHCTIGYGTALHHGACDGRAEEQRYARGIAEDAAMQMLVARVSHIEDMLNDTVRVALGQNQADALASFVFSLGHKRFRESTLLRQLNEGNYAAVPVELRKWTKARHDGALVDVPELVQLRNAEAELFARPDIGAAQSMTTAGGPAAPPLRACQQQ
ncbi:lysozyme [Caballeronia arationis]|uniref:lysozyme n=1 Tax=Caballeronia arationis TaxID=1777142 RepID=UPI00074CA8B1|nr:lysozyme [Caballeronia arationis]SAL05098.1 lysozyme [Caballeronia arationis]